MLGHIDFNFIVVASWKSLSAGIRIQHEIDLPERPVKIDPLGGACKRFAPEAAQAVFASLIIGDDQRIFKHFEMLEGRG